MAAPKYNLYALGNNGGRPAHYETPEQLDKRVSEYFDFIVEQKEEATMSGLTLFVGFSSRSTWVDYSKRSKEFSYIVNKARLCVSKTYELELHTFKWGGGAFALRNLDPDYWKEEQTNNTNVTGIESIVVNFGSNPIHTSSESKDNT